MIDQVRLAYAALATHGAPAENGLTVLPLRGVKGIFVAVDTQSRQHLLLEADAEVVATPNVSTLTVTTRNLIIDGRNARLLDIVCLFTSLSEVFDHFADAMIGRVTDGGEPPNVALNNVLSGWRDFLVAPKGPVGRDKLAATLGELLVVRDVVRSGTTDIGFWVGPFGQRHDMRSGSTAVEVKTTRSHTGYRVTIHGEDQLLSPDNGTLHMHLVRLEEVHDGSVRVSTVVDDLLAAGVSAEKLFAALAANGVPIGDIPASDGISFEVRERVTFPIDDKTPRIVPESFVSGRRPTGVLDISYVIDLTGAVHDSLSDAAYAALMSSFTTTVKK
ncbi:MULTISPECIES: PD-(D/E)XK motif protein [unclassified Mycobacterium]|uniref:PD-(D/E)XK motif protein n=1 Tax=unclassified Mycobacterium TaxID=2642494 RepID=UPI0029C95FB4|nr:MULTISPECIES: PD-(D/E)XK motif protein [unclassified Mycobacterium]